MSLVAFATRLAVVRVIQSVVWSGFDVFDSPPAPLDMLETGKGLIAVYTGQAIDRTEQGDMLSGDPTVSVDIQIFLPPEVSLNVNGATLTLDTRKAGADTALDVIARRIMAGLLSESTPWSDLFMNVAHERRRTLNASYLVETSKVRVAARQITIECGTINEPQYGAPATDIWQTLIALMRADTTAPMPTAPLADWIAAEIEGPQALDQADIDRIFIGLTTYAAQAVGIAPYFDSVNDAAPADSIGELDVPLDPNAPAPDGYTVS